MVDTPNAPDQAYLRALANDQEDRAAAEPTAARRGENATDLGNARRLVNCHGADLHHVRGWGWLVYDGTRWEIDTTGEAERRAKDTVRTIYREASQARDDADRAFLGKHATSSERAPAIRNMLTLAETEAEIAAAAEAFDRDPWLLNVLNGTIDLRTGELQAHARDDLITKRAPVEFQPGATCPTWERFVDEIMGGSRELVEYLQRGVGYSLTGDTSEQVILFLYGPGANGKSTVLELLGDLLGDYAKQTDPSTFLERKGDGPRNDLAKLRGARFVTGVEVGQGRRLAEQLVKQITGSDSIVARFLYHEEFTFRPTFKIWIGTNHKPGIRGTDYALWRRIRLIPFTVTIPEDRRDKQLPAKLRAELSGILNWALRGCLAWRRHGLGDVTAVRVATQDYRAEMDALGTFLDECCELDAAYHEGATRLYQAYRRWATDAGEHVLSQTSFGRELTHRELVADKVGRGSDRVAVRLGIRLIHTARGTVGESGDGSSITFPSARADEKVTEVASQPSPIPPHSLNGRHQHSADANGKLFEARQTVPTLPTVPRGSYPCPGGCGMRFSVPVTTPCSACRGKS